MGKKTVMSSSLQNSFSEFCNNNKFEINKKQTEILTSIEKFIFPRNKLLNFFSKKEVFTCFYLYGSVGVGKTMIANFVYDKINLKKIMMKIQRQIINLTKIQIKMKVK